MVTSITPQPRTLGNAFALPGLRKRRSEAVCAIGDILQLSKVLLTYKVVVRRLPYSMVPKCLSARRMHSFVTDYFDFAPPLITQDDASA